MPTTTCYLEVLATQRPFPISVDDNERTMFSVNFTAESNGIAVDWERDVIRMLLAGGVTLAYTFPDGNRKTDDTFIGPAAVIPIGPGPYIEVIDTGGADPIETHNGDIREQLSVQLLVRGREYYAARDLILECWRALHGIRDQNVVTP